MRLARPSAIPRSRGVADKNRDRWAAIASAAADLLVVAVDCFRDARVHDAAKVGLIDAEPERRGADDEVERALAQTPDCLAARRGIRLSRDEHHAAKARIQRKLPPVFASSTRVV